MSDTASSKDSGGIGTLGAMAIGVGGMVGGGIFAVLGEAVSLAHGATAIAFLIAGAVALLTSYSYVKLSVAFPSQGGTLVFIDRAFGKDLTTGIINLVLWLSYLVTLSLYAVAFGSYALTFFDDPPGWLKHALISAGIVVPVVINLVSARLVSKSETLIVVIKLLLLLVVVGAGFGSIDVERVAPASWGSPLTMVVAGMVIFVAYEGFELIANSADEVRAPKKTLPRAFYGSVILVIALYVLVAIVTVGAVPEAKIAEAKDYALAAAARPSLGQIGFVTVAISALLATLSAINATIYGSARLGFALAKDGELPATLEETKWSQPAASIVAVGGLSLVMANTIDLTSISIVASAGFLLIFAITNAAAVRLAKDTGGNRCVSGFASVACAAALVTLMVHSYQEDPGSLWVFLGFIGVAVAFEVTWGRLRRGSFEFAHRDATKDA